MATNVLYGVVTDSLAVCFSMYNTDIVITKVDLTSITSIPKHLKQLVVGGEDSGYILGFRARREGEGRVI